MINTDLQDDFPRPHVAGCGVGRVEPVEVAASLSGAPPTNELAAHQRANVSGAPERGKDTNAPLIHGGAKLRDGGSRFPLGLRVARHRAGVQVPVRVYARAGGEAYPYTVFPRATT
jgi:hypothetical protein